MRKSKERYKQRLATLVVLALLLQGCVSFSPNEEWLHPHRDSALTETQDGLVVSAIVLPDDEAKHVYGVNLGRLGIRAIWLSISNDTDETYHLLPSSLDLDYFSQNEAAYRFHSIFRPKQNRRLSEHFHDLAIDKHLKGRETSEGFVLVNRHRGGRYLIVELLGDQSLQRFDFVFTLPDGQFDFESVDFDNLYSTEEQEDMDSIGLKQWIEELPCCTTSHSGEKQGDPINVVIIGEIEQLMGSLTRSGWAFTETTQIGAVWDSVQSTLFGTPEFNYPISPLYVFGRHQDFAMQRPRGSIPQRNHMRLWLAPVRYEGQQVWLVQLSRDIGVKPTWHSPYLMTHVIDPEVDEDRAYLLELLMRSQSVKSFGYLSGFDEATKQNPRYNLSGDPYRTDGQRLVIKLADKPVAINNVEKLQWIKKTTTQVQR